MKLISKVEVNAQNDAGEEEVIVRLANGRVLQISPTFNSVNIWEAGAWDESERPYCVEGKFRSVHVEMGGSEG